MKSRLSQIILKNGYPDVITNIAYSGSISIEMFNELCLPLRYIIRKAATARSEHSKTIRRKFKACQVEIL